VTNAQTPAGIPPENEATRADSLRIGENMRDSRSPRYGTVYREYALQLATTAPEDDGPVWMVNLMKYREVAQYADGRESTISGREADDLYSPIDTLTEIGAQPVFFGGVDQQLLGDAPIWDRVAIVKYPTRKSFIDMQARPKFQESHKHKDAGMDQTIVMGCQPMPYPQAPEGTLWVDWAHVPFPPTDEDGPVTVVHVLRFEDAEAAHISPDAMEAYTSAAAVVASKHGVRVAGWFAVEGTIVGDGRAWHQVRFNLFPNKRAFMAVVTDPLRAQPSTSSPSRSARLARLPGRCADTLRVPLGDALGAHDDPGNRSPPRADWRPAQRTRWSASVFVVVLAVSCVPAAIVNVVDVIAVRDGHMAAPFAVNMGMTLMHGVAARGLAFVVVIVVRSMKMTVVHIVDVITVGDRDMPAPFAMGVVMVGMFVVRCIGHSFLAAVPSGTRPNSLSPAHG
jgi:uncharacterized protein (DUF1330 family)